MESTTSIQTATEPRPAPGGAARLIRKVKKVTKRKFTADQKIRIVLEGFRKEIPIAELCRREKVSSAVYYKWLKEFMEGGREWHWYKIILADKETKGWIVSKEAREGPLEEKVPWGTRLMHYRTGGFSLGR